MLLYLIIKLAKGLANKLECLFINKTKLSLCMTDGIYFNAFDKETSFISKEKMFEQSGKCESSVRKCCALDLNVRLELYGKNAVRRLRVPAEITFEQLHKLLQKAFEWEDYHLYSFGLFKEWSEDYYARPDIEFVKENNLFGDGFEFSIMQTVKLSDYVSEYKKILYLYDFGDNWRHYIEIENVIENCEDELPVLIFGEGDVPPEAVGGVDGYAYLLEVISDPENSDYEQMTELLKSQNWCPFDFERVSRSIREE